jgi:outer membrane protein assembly factor BamB
MITKFFWISLLIPFSLFSVDWPHWLGPTKDGLSTEKNWGSALENIQWKKKVGIGFSTVVVADNRLFTIGHDGKKQDGKEIVSCLDPKNGKLLWSDSYPAPLIDYLHEGGPCSTPTIDRDLVYCLSKHGLLHAYNTKNGEKIWKQDMLSISGMNKPPEWGFAASPYILGDLLLIEAGATYALNKSTGQVMWKSKNYRPAYGTPAIFRPNGQEIIAVLKTDGLVLLDPKNGKTLDFVPWETSYRTNASTPIVRDTMLFISTGYRRGCALFEWKKDKLVKRYENKNLSTHMSHAILYQDHLYGFDGNVHMAGPKDFVCLNFSSGKVQWRVTDRGLQIGSLLIAGDRIIALGQKGEMVIAQATPEKFNEISREQVMGGKCWTMPVLANGFLYIRNARGDLVCFDLSK